MQDPEPPDPRGDDRRPADHLPDRLDRLWLHPSELPAGPAARTTPSPGRAAGGIGIGRWASAAAAGATGALATVVVLAALGLIGRADPPPEPTAAPLGGEVRADPRDAVARVAPSIVRIRADSAQGTVVGTGVCVRREGDVLTSVRLVPDGATVTVTDASGRERDATVIGRDPDGGLALLSVEGGLPAATLGIRRLDVGAAVLAVGAGPVGGAPWMSGGIVSSSAARLGTEDGLAATGLIQTDAAAAAEAAGGALVDPVRGTIEGILLGSGDGRAGLYAVPIATALDVADSLRRSGHVARPWLGIRGGPASGGVRIDSVLPDGPADRAGLQVGDVLTTIDGATVTSIYDVKAEIRSAVPGDTVDLGLVREGRRLVVPADLEPEPADTTAEPGAEGDAGVEPAATGALTRPALGAGSGR